MKSDSLSRKLFALFTQGNLTVFGPKSNSSMKNNTNVVVVRTLAPFELNLEKGSIRLLHSAIRYKCT
jgi:hypothetical protein